MKSDRGKESLSVGGSAGLELAALALAALWLFRAIKAFAGSGGGLFSPESLPLSGEPCAEPGAERAAYWTAPHLLDRGSLQFRRRNHCRLGFVPPLKPLKAFQKIKLVFGRFL